MAVEFRNGSGCVALIIGCFGVVRSGHAIFSVYGTRVRDQWQQRALGELLVRRLEVAVLEKCADLHADPMEMTLPGGGCHRKVVSLLMYSKCDWRIIHRSKEISSPLTVCAVYWRRISKYLMIRTLSTPGATRGRRWNRQRWQLPKPCARPSLVQR